MAVKKKIKRTEEEALITFDEAFDMFIQEKEAMNLSAATINNYQKIMSLIYRYFEFNEETPVNAITLPEIYRYINHLRAEGVGPATIQAYIRVLKVFLAWCMDENRRYIDPPFKVGLPKAKEEPIKFFTEDEIELLLERPKRNALFTEWRNWAVVNWILATGNRVGTVVNIKVGDVDLKNKEIYIHHTKTKKVQIIPMSSTLEIVLKEYIRTWRKDAPADAYLFPNVGDEKLLTNSMSKSFSAYAKARGVERTSIHGLRHSFARMWVKNNGNLFQLQKILGHSTLEMTKRYSKLFAEDLKQDFDAYSPLDTISRSKKRTQLIKNRR